MPNGGLFQSPEGESGGLQSATVLKGSFFQSSKMSSVGLQPLQCSNGFCEHPVSSGRPQSAAMFQWRPTVSAAVLEQKFAEPTLASANFQSSFGLQSAAVLNDDLFRPQR